jgi:hypothetical protein
MIERASSRVGGPLVDLSVYYRAEICFAFLIFSSWPSFPPGLGIPKPKQKQPSPPALGRNVSPGAANGGWTSGHPPPRARAVSFHTRRTAAYRTPHGVSLAEHFLLRDAKRARGLTFPGICLVLRVVRKQKKKAFVVTAHPGLWPPFLRQAGGRGTRARTTGPCFP